MLFQRKVWSRKTGPCGTGVSFPWGINELSGAGGGTTLARRRHKPGCVVGPHPDLQRRRSQKPPPERGGPEKLIHRRGKLKKLKPVFYSRTRDPVSFLGPCPGGPKKRDQVFRCNSGEKSLLVHLVPLFKKRKLKPKKTKN